MTTAPGNDAKPVAPSRSFTIPDEDGRRWTASFHVGKDGTVRASFPYGEHSTAAFVSWFHEVDHAFPDGDDDLASDLVALDAVVGTDAVTGMPPNLEGPLAKALASNWPSEAWNLLEGAVHGDEIVKAAWAVHDPEALDDTKVELRAIEDARVKLVDMARRAMASPLGRVPKASQGKWEGAVATLAPVLDDTTYKILTSTTEPGRLAATLEGLRVPTDREGLPPFARTKVVKRTKARKAADQARVLIDMAAPVLAQRAEAGRAAMAKPDVLHPDMPPVDRDPRTAEGFLATEGIAVRFEDVSTERVPVGNGDHMDRATGRLVLSSDGASISFRHGGPYVGTTNVPATDVVEALQHALSAAERYDDADGMFDETVGTGTSDDFRRVRDAYDECVEVREAFVEAFGDDAFRRLLTEVGEEPPFKDDAESIRTVPASASPAP